jgi:hypothetical protein
MSTWGYGYLWLNTPHTVFMLVPVWARFWPSPKLDGIQKKVPVPLWKNVSRPAGFLLQANTAWAPGSYSSQRRAETWNPIKAPWLLREKYAKNLPFLVKILSLLTKTILEISKISLSFIHFPLYSSSMYFYPSFMFKFPLFIFQIHGFSW